MPWICYLLRVSGAGDGAIYASICAHAYSQMNQSQKKTQKIKKSQPYVFLIGVAGLPSWILLVFMVCVPYILYRLVVLREAGYAREGGAS